MFEPVARFAADSLRYSAELILPPVCVSCAAPVTRHNLLCAKCWGGLVPITAPYCGRLGIPLPGYDGSGPHLSVQSFTDPPIFDRARAACVYGGVIRKLVVRFKFEDRHEPLPLFLRLMRDAGRELLADADIIVPVPLHRFRLLQRRFNQSALLAQGLSRASGVPALVMALKRTKRTKAQVGLQHDARRANVAEAFAISADRRRAVAGKRVLLVDDVVTTGATANACAAALIAAGARAVDVLAVALVWQGAPAFLDEGEDVL
ncbi:ComF family protein [Rhodomicrobium lacus]|uniref:ComF family protein n=1 Tax=Rhodomicrobium lacus TaxID=2498452 RepID=UPI0026E36AE2|nr:ComF family protein [Rhodomicrobium lacus]WKW49617.1 ComF family protein [Rhodomicrobium lacus]